MRVVIPTRVAVLAALLASIGASTLQAEIRSKSNEIVVLRPSDLPEQAQTPGNTFFLFSDNDGAHICM